MVHNLTSNTDDERKNLFTSVSKIIKPGYFFRKALVVYADRKIIILAWLHFVVSLVIYAHFGQIKFDQQRDEVPLQADRYWWKVLVPTFEFGAMHTILFQLAVIPLTMCRLTTVKASTTFLEKLIPFGHMFKAHKVLGYTLMILLFLTTALFLTFFGLLCNDGDEGFCSKLTSEIMITGYVIFASFMAVGITSYLRHTIPYSIFYVVHHVVFIAYIITIAHTLDNVARQNGGRNQTFKWFSASILFYITDRAAMYLNHRYKTLIDTSIIVKSKNGRQMIILKVNKPILFHFTPGQYVFLKVPEIGKQNWKPYSISSAPDSDVLEFYIEVHGEGSWTHRLMKLVKRDDDSSDEEKESLNNDDMSNNSVRSNQDINVEILGPYGVGLGDVEDYSHGLLIGAGTGIVPVLSLFQQHIYQLLRLEPKTYAETHEEHLNVISSLVQADQHKIGSICVGLYKRWNDHSKRVASFLKDIGRSSRTSSQAQSYELKGLSRVAQTQLYWYMLLMSTPVFGCVMLAFTLSWNNLPFDISYMMIYILFGGTIAFQIIFILITLLIQKKNSFIVMIDLVIGIVSVFADWYWFARDKWGNFLPIDIIHYSLLIGYMFFRLWYSAVNPSKNPVEKSNKRRLLVNFDKVHLVWTTRSASLVSQVYPDILQLWEELCSHHGIERSRQMCEVSIYVTDKDSRAVKMLQCEIKHTSLDQEGCIHFNRLDLKEIMIKDTACRITTRSATQTLLAFCGSKELGRVVKQAKVLQDISLRITGNHNHEVHLVIETNRTVDEKKVTKPDNRDDDNSNNEESTHTFSRRKVINGVRRKNDAANK